MKRLGITDIGNPTQIDSREETHYDRRNKPMSDQDYNIFHTRVFFSLQEAPSRFLKDFMSSV